MKTETYDCLGCGIAVVRPVVRGQRPKWCDPCRGRGTRKQITCAHCGELAWTWRKGQFCSRECGNRARATGRKPYVRKPKPKVDRRSDLRRSYEDRDPALFFAALVAAADTTGECWVWPNVDSKGYARVHWSNAGLYRLTLEVKHCAPLGSQHAHHVCANTACVNPDHLQPVTHRDNIAEMLARQSYLSRIAELETALAEVAPDHPLLTVIAVA